MRMREQRGRAAELPPAQIAQKASEKVGVAVKKPSCLLGLAVSDYHHNDSAMYPPVMRTDGTRKRQPLLIKKRI